MRILATACRVLLLCWCLPALAQQVELERKATTNGAILISEPKGGAALNPFEVSISNQTASWYVLRTDPLSSINNAGTPIVFTLGPYQTKRFPAALNTGQFIGWHAVSALALDEIPNGENADLATAALGLFTIDVMARLIFNVELPPSYTFNDDIAVTGLKTAFSLSGNDALILITDLAEEYEKPKPDTGAIMSSITTFVLLTKENWINGQLGFVIRDLFNGNVASRGVELLGGIAGALDAATYIVRAESVRELVSSTKKSPRNDYVQIRALPSIPLPIKPSRLTATATGDTVSLSWDAATGADGYRLKYRLGAGSENALDVKTQTALTIPNVPAGTYQVSVEAYNRQGGSGYTDFVTVTVSPRLPLTIPAGFVVQGGLIWSPANRPPSPWADANSYCTSAALATRPGRLPSLLELASMAVSGRLNAGYQLWSGTPVPGQNGYYYVVYIDPTRVFNGQVDTRRSSEGSYTSCVYAGDVPAPKNLTATAGNGQVSLQWSAVSGATSYTVYRSTDPNVTPRNYATLPGGTKTPTMSTLYIQTGLANNTTYYFTVTAVNALGESIEADAVKATPVQASVPDGYVIQGGLLWMPASLELDWTAANAYCTGTVINGQSGWRLPTRAETTAFKSAFAVKGGFSNVKWKTKLVWTATGSASSHEFYDLVYGTGFSALNVNKFGVTCVH